MSWSLRHCVLDEWWSYVWFYYFKLHTHNRLVLVSARRLNQEESSKWLCGQIRWHWRHNFTVNRLQCHAAQSKRTRPTKDQWLPTFVGWDTPTDASAVVATHRRTSILCLIYRSFAQRRVRHNFVILININRRKTCNTRDYRIVVKTGGSRSA